MTLLDHINAALKPYLTKAGEFWHNDVEPWFANLLKTIGSDGAKVAAAEAKDLVEQEAPALAEAAATGDVQGFFNKQATIAATAATSLLKQEKATVLGDVSVAVAGLVAAHPTVAAVGATPTPTSAPPPAATGNASAA